MTQLALFGAIDAATQREPYNGEPPFVAGSETSEAAAEEIKPRRKAIAQKVLNFIREQGSHGAICHEVERSLGLRHQTASARVRELFLADQIIKTDRKRKTESGRLAFVYVVEAS